MPQMTDRYDAKPEKRSLYMLEQIYDKIYLDDSFQRRGGVERGSGWKIDDSNKYLTNLLQGKTFNSVIVAEVDSCIKHAYDEGCLRSVAYFEAIRKKGEDYVSIDGNNTTSSITHFLRGHEEIGIGPEKKKLVDFSAAEQNDIKYVEKVNFVVLRKILADEMTDLFQDLNTDQSLNPQEHRHGRR